MAAAMLLPFRPLITIFCVTHQKATIGSMFDVFYREARKVRVNTQILTTILAALGDWVQFLQLKSAMKG
jgi:hypothetical protein